MFTRENTYRQFGPILTEAICLVLLDEINTLKDNQGMPQITGQDILDKLNNHLSHLEPYEWMNTGEP